jgi:acyl carrier protein
MSEKRNSAGLEMRVIDFVSNQLSVSKDTLSLQNSLYEDFGVDGDDGVEFIEAFSNEFSVNISAVKYEKHFQPEGGVTPFFMLYPFLYLLKRIFGWEPE